MILIPEIILKKLVDTILTKIDSEFLYLIFEECKLNNYNFYENAVSIFLRKKDSQRAIETHLFFNRDRANLPTIHLNMPSESHGGDTGNTLAGTEGKFDSPESLDYRIISTRSYQAKFSMIFTSDNTFEVAIMYNVIKMALQGNMHLLEENGLRNAKLSGGDIIFNDGLMPIGIYAKALHIDCIYSYEAPSLTKKRAVTGFVVNN